MKNPIKKGSAWLENVIYRIHAKGYFLFHYSKGVCKSAVDKQGTLPSTTTTFK